MIDKNSEKIKKRWKKWLGILITLVGWVWLIFFPLGLKKILPFLAVQWGDGVQAKVAKHHIEFAPLGQDIIGKSHQHYMLNVEFNNKGRLEDHDLEVDSGDLYKNTADGALVGIHYFSFFPYRPALDVEMNKNLNYSTIFPFVVFIVSIFGLVYWYIHLDDEKKKVRVSRISRPKHRN